MQTHATYLVIGAGLAGCTCAYLLKKGGADVLLVERQRLEDKDKLCAGLITPRSIRLLQKIYGSASGALFQSDFDSLRCLIGRRTVDVHGITMKSLDRADLDAFALSAYRSLGGRVVDGLTLRDVEPKRHEAQGFFRGGEPFDVSFETVIAADGALSTTRTMLTGKRQELVLTLEAKIDAIRQPLTFAYDGEWYGYSWYGPIGDHATIGCGCYAGPSALEEQLASFAAQIGASYGKLRGAYLPSGRDVLLEKDGCWFIGDAAGLISPISGEGIYYALFSAKQLVRSLENHASYPALMAKARADVERQYKGRGLFFSERLIDAILGATAPSPSAQEAAVKRALRFAGYEC